MLGRPLIIIGAGRSGSSLLREMLQSHQDICMFGEMEFGVTALWRSCWSVSAVVERRGELLRAAARDLVTEGPENDNELLQAEAALARSERERIGTLIRSLLGEVLDVASLSEGWWGFKEIWIGDRLADDWAPYDTIFPAARYLHIVRNPYEFARSAADWNGMDFTADYLRDSLRLWVHYLEMNRRQPLGERYQIVRYESLVSAPEKTLVPILATIGLTWDERCAERLHRKVVATEVPSLFPPETGEVARDVPELAPLMAEFGYSQPSEERILRPAVRDNRKPVAVTGVVEIAPQHWQLEPPFRRDGAAGWVCLLSDLAVPADWIRVADVSEAPLRSDIVLYENEMPLGPAHSIHALIRDEGGGRYSHWGNGHMLLFSTSDGSNPNENGRRYSVRRASGQQRT